MAKKTSRLAKPTSRHKRLAAFVGRWKTEGEIKSSASGPAVRFRATDRYEWLPGGFFLIHHFAAQMPDGQTEGIEIIGHDPSRNIYPMQAFDSQGHTVVMTARVTGDSWTFTGKSARFKGGFRDQGRIFAGQWEQRSREGAKWRPWMKIKLTKMN